MLANLDFSGGAESVATLGAMCSLFSWLNFFIKSCIIQIMQVHEQVQSYLNPDHAVSR
jgi:hypothetical protein